MLTDGGMSKIKRPTGHPWNPIERVRAQGASQSKTEKEERNETENEKRSERVN